MKSITLTLTVDGMTSFIRAVESNIRNLNDKNIRARIEYNEELADEDELKQIKEMDAEVKKLLNLVSLAKQHFADQGFFFNSSKFYIPEDGKIREPEGFVKTIEVSA